MSDRTSPSEPERTALNVFHDLELLHVRQDKGAPQRATRQTNDTPVAPDSPVPPQPKVRTDISSA